MCSHSCQSTRLGSHVDDVCVRVYSCNLTLPLLHCDIECGPVIYRPEVSFSISVVAMVTAFVYIIKLCDRELLVMHANIIIIMYILL